MNTYSLSEINLKAITTNLTIMRFFALITALAACAASALAVPALRKPITVTQPDGSTITVQLRGDERAHCYLSEDGYLLVNDNDAFYYGNVSADGLIERSDLIARRPEMRTDADRAFLAKVDMKLVDATLRNIAAESRYGIADAARRQAAKASASRAAANDSHGVGRFPGTHFPVIGEQKGLVVLVQYKDVKFNLKDPYDYFSRLLNEQDFSDYGGTGSARDYFIENSNGQFMPEFDVYGPITLSQNRSYYGGNDSYGNDKAPEKMAIEACQQLDSTVDFTQYDRDGDGLIDNVYVFYAGMGEAEGGGSNTVWPHSWDVRYANGGPYMFDGVQLANYACSNEWYGKPDGIGTFVHEFSHVMGLPDLYATDYTSSFTPGEWSVLDYGPYNNDSRTPPGYSAFERNALEWCQPTILESKAGSYTLNPISDSNEAFLIPTSSPNEFFLLENRQQAGWDNYIPGHGMLIWHIDYNANVWSSNEVNNTPSHQYVDLEEADGKQSDYNRAGDAFPGTSKVTSFTDATKPGMLTWSGQKLYTPIVDIAENNGVITFRVDAAEKPAPLTLNEPDPELVTTTSFTMSWSEVEGVSYYKVHVDAVDGSYTGRYKDRNVGTRTSIEITGLQPNTEYTAYVVPVTTSISTSQIIFGDPSNTITVRTLEDASGIGSVAIDADLPAEYYTLQGIRVNPDALTPGIYIVRQGTATHKISIR